MSTIFTKIINNELPSRMVYEDKFCVAFLSINPVADGHTLIVPRLEMDKWVELPTDVWLACNKAAQLIGKAIVKAFECPRAGYLIAGFEVPHMHIHVFPAYDMSGFSLENAAQNPDPKIMDEAAEKIRNALVEVAKEL